MSVTQCENDGNSSPVRWKGCRREEFKNRDDAQGVMGTAGSLGAAVWHGGGRWAGWASLEELWSSLSWRTRRAVSLTLTLDTVLLPVSSWEPQSPADLHWHPLKTLAEWAPHHHHPLTPSTEESPDISFFPAREGLSIDKWAGGMN